MRTLVDWEHESIVIFHDLKNGSAQIILCSVDVITQGSFFPPQIVFKKYMQLKRLFMLCKSGEVSYSEFLRRMGYANDAELTAFQEDRIEFIIS